MITATISDFRKNIKEYLNEVTQNFETLILNRGKGKGVVIMSLEEYNSMQETNYLLSSKANAKRLEKAIENFEKGRSFKKDLLE